MVLPYPANHSSSSLHPEILHWWKIDQDRRKISVSPTSNLSGYRPSSGFWICPGVSCQEHLQRKEPIRHPDPLDVRVPHPTHTYSGWATTLICNADCVQRDSVQCQARHERFEHMWVSLGVHRLPPHPWAPAALQERCHLATLEPNSFKNHHSSPWGTGWPTNYGKGLVVCFYIVHRWCSEAAACSSVLNTVIQMNSGGMLRVFVDVYTYYNTFLQMWINLSSL